MIGPLLIEVLVSLLLYQKVDFLDLAFSFAGISFSLLFFWFESRDLITRSKE